MTPPHPTLEQMAKLLAGKMEYDELAFEVLPHLLAQCEVCSARVAEIRRLQGQVGHWNEMVAVFESREAPALVERLSRLLLEAQLRQAETEESLQGWGGLRPAPLEVPGGGVWRAATVGRAGNPGGAGRRGRSANPPDRASRSRDFTPIPGEHRPRSPGLNFDPTSRTDGAAGGRPPGCESLRS